MSKKSWPCVTLLLLTGFPAASQETLQLSLEQAVDLALEKNLSLRSARLNTRISAAGIQAEKARFGRRLTGGLFHQSERSPSISSLEDVENTATNSQSLNLGIAQELSAGGRLGLDYGSLEARELAGGVMRAICHQAYRASLTLAREKGPFPLFQAGQYLDAPFVRRLPEPIRAEIAATGIRNSHLLAVAPGQGQFRAAQPC